jgi:hypothetical protein
MSHCLSNPWNSPVTAQPESAASRVSLDASIGRGQSSTARCRIGPSRSTASVCVAFVIAWTIER